MIEEANGKQRRLGREKRSLDNRVNRAFRAFSSLCFVYVLMLTSETTLHTAPNPCIPLSTPLPPHESVRQSKTTTKKYVAHRIHNYRPPPFTPAALRTQDRLGLGQRTYRKAGYTR